MSRGGRVILSRFLAPSGNSGDTVLIRPATNQDDKSVNL